MDIGMVRKSSPFYHLGSLSSFRIEWHDWNYAISEKIAGAVTAAVEAAIVANVITPDAGSLIQLSTDGILSIDGNYITRFPEPVVQFPYPTGAMLAIVGDDPYCCGIATQWGFRDEVREAVKSVKAAMKAAKNDLVDMY